MVRFEQERDMNTMGDLRPRQIEILKSLIASGTPIGMDVFMARFNKSERTIHYDLLEIKRILEDKGITLKMKSKQGFYIPVVEKIGCMELLGSQEQVGKQPHLYDREKLREELVIYLAFKNKARRIDDIASDLSISASTAQRLITTINEADFPFSISKTKNGFELNGDEEEIRWNIAKILTTYIEGLTTVEEWIDAVPYATRESINEDVLENISISIKNTNGKFNVWISNQGYLNLVSYSLLQTFRSKKEITTDIIVLETEEYKYAFDVLRQLSNEKMISNAEVKMLVNNMVRNGVITPAEETYFFDIEDTVDAMVALISLECKKKNLEVYTEQLKKDLQFHLSHYLKLVKYNIPLEDNTLLREIKDKYGQYFKMAAKAVMLFEDKYRTDITETEISYIAIYIFKNIVLMEDRKIKAYVVCATGKGLSNLLTTRLRNIFPQIEILGHTSAYGVLDNVSGLDVIISTISLPKAVIPVIKISPILTNDDIQRIQSFLNLGNATNQIPVKQNEMVYVHKFDPFNLKDIEVDANKSDLANASMIISKITLTLLEYLSKISDKNQLNPDALLGIIIHMNMAVSRWFEESDNEVDIHVENGYIEIEHNYPNIYETMEKFFELVEATLLVTISRKEKYAFYLYILNKENDDYETTN